MTPQPHPLRCETCDHYNGGEYFDKCKNEIFPDNMDSTERQYIKDWISSHGCASHSAASRPAPSAPTDEQCRICSEAIRKDEREKVLEQFAIRVRREFAQDDDEEWYLSSYDFEDCLEELKNDE